jgi:hypothetical protein
MCFGGQQTPAPVTPAPAPAPPAAAPTETSVGAGRKAENLTAFGTPLGPSTRVDRSADGGTQGGSGLNL